jgi:5-methylcytosine-specific restriction endonuclease McrA
MGARDRIRAFLETNVGRIVTTHEIGEVAQIRDYQRRIRELRDEEGMQIRSHIDRHDLRPGEYMLESLERVPVIGRGISPPLRAEILERNGYTCQLCGSGAGDRDPFNPSRKVRLHIDHIIPISQGGTDAKDNLRVLCSSCNQGRANIRTPTEDARNILARIRRTPRSVQREVYEALKRTFGD